MWLVIVNHYKGDLMRYLYIILGLLLIMLLIWRIVHKMKYGGSCCDSHSSADAKIKSKDRNKLHYPHHYVIDIEGMVCGTCAVKVEMPSTVRMVSMQP